MRSWRCGRTNKNYSGKTVVAMAMIMFMDFMIIRK